jgi:hypothetical protein
MNKAILTHWTSACRATCIDILSHLLHTPRNAIQQQNGYVVIAGTPLAVPCTLVTAQELQSYPCHVHLAWQCLTRDPAQKFSMFAFLLSLQTCHPDKKKLLHKLQTRVAALTQQDIYTSQAFTAGRTDLQSMVLLGYETLRSIFKSPTAVGTALAAVCAVPWHFQKASLFYHSFLATCARAAIAVHIDVGAAAPPATPPLATIDKDIVVYTLEKDKYLLVYLLSFAVDRVELQGAPSALLDFWKKLETAS